MPRKKATLAVPPPVPAGHSGAVDRTHPAAVKRELRALFRDTFDVLGGVAWLVAFARRDDQNARTFVQALSRLIPLELTGKDGAPLTVIVRRADGTEEQVDLNPQPPAIAGSSERVH